MKKPSKSLPIDEIRYVDISQAIAIHDRMLEIGGGRQGIRDFTLIHSAVERPKATFAGRPLYPAIWLQAAAMLQSLIMNHPFNDGNKRTGFFTTMRFLEINGYGLNPTHDEIIKFTTEVDTRQLNLEKIALWLKKHARKRK